MKCENNQAALAKTLKGKAYWTEKELSERLNISLKWLQKMRTVGGGPPFVRLGGSVRYKIERILEWEDSVERQSTSDSGGSLRARPS